jgi:hypothetical protein
LILPRFNPQLNWRRLKDGLNVLSIVKDVGDDHRKRSRYRADRETQGEVVAISARQSSLQILA